MQNPQFLFAAAGTLGLGFGASFICKAMANRANAAADEIEATWRHMGVYGDAQERHECLKAYMEEHDIKDPAEVTQRAREVSNEITERWEKAPLYKFLFR